jgi:hypothetical protein
MGADLDLLKIATWVALHPTRDERTRLALIERGFLDDELAQADNDVRLVSPPPLAHQLLAAVLDENGV